MKFHGILRGGIFPSSAANAVFGATPRSRRRTAPRAPTSTESTRNTGCVWSASFSLGASTCRSTSFTRTTFLPLTSITCWSSRSRSSRNRPSVPLTTGHSAAAVLVRIPPLIAETAANGSTRFPDLVFTMRDEIRDRSSCGASATSRTRPDAPDGSYTVAPNNSLRASVVIPLENNQLAHDSERKSQSEKRKSQSGPRTADLSPNGPQPRSRLRGEVRGLKSKVRGPIRERPRIRSQSGNLRVSRPVYYLHSVRHIFDIIGQTFRALWAHKLRSFLTMFGIAWGVGSLLLLVGLGEGFRAGNRKQFDSLGENVMFIWSGRAPVMQGSFTALRQYYLTYRDYQDIVNECPSVGAAAPVISRNDIRAVSDFFQASGQIMGVPANINQIRNLPINEGRWINDMDDAQKRTVIVIGDEVRRTLFPGRPAVGATILLNGIRFTVIGTLQKIGHGDNMNLNLRSFVPFHAMQDYFRPLNTGIGTDVISLINYQPKSRALHETAQQEVHKIIARNHGFDPNNPDSFDEWDTIKTIDQIGKIFEAMKIFRGSVGLVTLALGAIGIINIMLVAVADRTREIGLRKAVGATNASIMFQFFVEGAFLTLLSGGIGIGGAAGLMALLSGVDLGQGFDPPKLVASTAALAVISLGVAGVAAGLYPARRAAMLEPVEALRKE